MALKGSNNSLIITCTSGVTETDYVLGIQGPALGLCLALASCLPKHRGKGCPVRNTSQGSALRGPRGVRICIVGVPGGNRAGSL